MVVDVRLTFKWQNSPGYWGVLSSAAKHSYSRTAPANSDIVEEGSRMMDHLEILEILERGYAVPIPIAANFKPSEGGVWRTTTLR